MYEVFRKNGAVLRTSYVQKGINCYLTPFSTIIRLTGPFKLKKKWFQKSDQTRWIYP